MQDSRYFSGSDASKQLVFVTHLQSVCVAYRSGIHTLSMEPVLVLLSEFFHLIFFMCVTSCLLSGFFPDLPICSLVMLSMRLLFLSSRIK